MKGRSVVPLWAWVIDGVLFMVIMIGAVGGVLMPAVLLDLVSFWPAYAAGGVAAILLRWRARNAGPLMHTAPALFVVFFMALALALYFARWPPLPSSSGDLTGPVPGPAGVADLAVAVSGTLTVSAGVEPLYRIELEREGGITGAPEAVEAISAGREVVRVRESDDSWWFQSAGWDLWLSVEPEWTLELRAGGLSADLRGIRLQSATISGNGTVALPATASPVSVEVQGDLSLNVPPGVPIQVVGSGAVPDGWTPTADGWASPTEGEGLTITVVSGSVAIEER